MSTQYDNIGERYKSMTHLPAAEPERPSVIAVLGKLDGLNCLDLACGLGRYTRLLVEQGASQAVGIDISQAMVDAAKTATKDLPATDQNKFAFSVGDCSQVSSVENGPFDLVFAAWLLNYASDRKEQLAMWQNIYHNLKPGNRFVALTPNVNLNMDEPLDPRYGVTVEGIGKIQDGWRTRLTAFTKPEVVQFENCHLSREVYESCAKEAGFVDLEWHRHVLPDDERKENGYWDIYDERPHILLLTARKP
ncbi:hypothetical protein MBLNU230_g4904t1 [Neophaeotheca triangularis]